MAKLADAPDLGSGGETRGGSTPFTRTRNIIIRKADIMQIVELVNEKLKRKFQITQTATDVNNRVELGINDAKDKINLPGFRPGKVPTALIKQRFGKELRQEAVELSVQDGIRAALSERDLKPAVQPQVTKLNTEIYDDEKIDLIFEVELEIMPEITIIDNEKISLIRYVEQTSDTEIDEFLAKLSQNYSKPQAISQKRAVQNGDVALIDFEGFLDGVAFPGGKGEGHPLEIGSNQFIPGFEEQIIGKNAGDEFTISVKFPEEYNAPNLAGKQTDFKIKLHEIQEKVAQEVDDEFAKSMGFENVEMLKNVVRGRIENQNDENARDVQKRQLLDQMDSLYEFDLPESMVEGDFKQLWDKVSHAHENNELDETDKGKSLAELETEYRKIAMRRVKLGLLLNEIGRREGIEVTEEEIKGRAMEQARQYPPEVRNQFLKLVNENQQFRMEISLPLFEEKVTGYLIEMTTREEVVMSKSDFAKKSAEIITASERKMSGGAYHAAHEHNHDHDHHDHDHDHDHDHHDHDHHDHDHDHDHHEEAPAKPAKKAKKAKAAE